MPLDYCPKYQVVKFNTCDVRLHKRVITTVQVHLNTLNDILFVSDTDTQTQPLPP